MKKLSVLVLAILLTLSGCGNIKTTKISTLGYGEFELPENLKEEDAQDNLYVSYSDVEENNGKYFGRVMLATYALSSEYTYEDAIETSTDIIIPEYNKILFENDDIAYDDVKITDIEVDGRKGTRYVTKGSDDFTFEYIIIDDEDTLLEAIIVYHTKKYPKLGDLFLKTYTIPKD